MSRFFCEHPLILSAIGLVAVNDHILKASDLAGPVTGKLSDIAGLFFVPFLFLDLASLIHKPWQRSAPLCLALVIVIALAFTALKCSAMARAFYQSLYALAHLTVQVTPDPSDLFALIMLPLALACHKPLQGALDDAR